MALRFKKASAVAIGTFNIYVVQPRWFAEIGIIPEGTYVKIEHDVHRPGFRYSIEGSPFRWIVSPDKIILETKSPKADCGQELATVLEKVPWTPLLAIGSNIEYVADKGQLSGLGINLPSYRPQDGYALRQRTAHVAIESGAQLFNFQIAECEELEFSVNIHTELKKIGLQAERNRVAIETCREFMRHRETAVELANRLFGVEVVYE